MENYVITVERGYGSNGCAIAQKLAAQLGLRYLDKELLALASIETGIAQDLFEDADEKVRFSIMDIRGEYDIDSEPEANVSLKSAKEYRLFHYQAETIRRLAKKESFIVIGRAADYILWQKQHVFSVNIQAPFEDCVTAIMERKFVDMKTAIKDIRRIDKSRGNFYRTYTGRAWNDALNYDLCINSAGFQEQDCVDLIRQGASFKFGFSI